MAKLSMQQIAYYLKEAGFPDSAIPTMVAIAYAESGGETTAVNDSAMGVTEYSVGIFQINLLAHPSVTEQCAMNPSCAAKEAFRISNNGTNFNPWSVFKNGLYQKYMSDATEAAKGVMQSAKEFLEGLPADELEKVLVKAPKSVIDAFINVLPDFPFKETVLGMIGNSVEGAMKWIPDDITKKAILLLPGHELEQLATLAGWGASLVDDVPIVGGAVDAAGAMAELARRIVNISMDDFKNAALSMVLIALAMGAILLGLYGIVNGTKLGKMAIDQGKSAALVAATKGKAA